MNVLVEAVVGTFEIVLLNEAERVDGSEGIGVSVREFGGSRTVVDIVRVDIVDGT